MSALAYTIATASPDSLLLAGFVSGVIVCNAVGLLVDFIRSSRWGCARG